MWWKIFSMKQRSASFSPRPFFKTHPATKGRGGVRRGRSFHSASLPSYWRIQGGRMRVCVCVHKWHKAEHAYMFRNIISTHILYIIWFSHAFILFAFKYFSWTDWTRENTLNNTALWCLVTACITPKITRKHDAFREVAQPACIQVTAAKISLTTGFFKRTMLFFWSKASRLVCPLLKTKQWISHHRNKLLI